MKVNAKFPDASPALRGLVCLHDLADGGAGGAGFRQRHSFATWSRTPLLDVGDVRPGLHLTTLGADEPGKIVWRPVAAIAWAGHRVASPLTL